MKMRVEVPLPARDAYSALHQQNARLQRAVEELSLLNEMAAEISSTYDLDAIMRRVVHRALNLIHAQQGVITIADRQTPDTAYRTLIRTRAGVTGTDALHPPESLLGWMHLNRAPIAIDIRRPDDRLRGVRWPEGVSSILSVPLMVRSELTGMVTLYNKDRGGFTADDRRLLSIIASQSAHVIENARLLEEEKAHLRVREELKLARRMQMSLLPMSAPRVEGYDLAGVSVPAQEVGGDYFDFVGLDDASTALAVGDVVGKGLPAALLMANLQATLRGQLSAAGPVDQCIARVNDQLCRSTRPETFASLFLGFLDPVRHRLDFANAGHNRPLVVRANGTIERLETGGLVLGIKSGFAYDAASTSLEPGETILIYSDGLTEAMNETRDDFDETGVRQVLSASRSFSAEAMLAALLDAVRKHVGKADPSDDITMIVVRRTG